VSVYPFIEAEKAEQDGNVAMACRLLEVSRAAYYEWSTHKPSHRKVSDDELAVKIEQIYNASRCTYGAPRRARACRRSGWRASWPLAGSSVVASAARRRPPSPIRRHNRRPIS
jgi:hypothetical protein